MGSFATHVQVVQPRFVRSAFSTPLATASSPAGTVMWKVYAALSLG